MKISRIIKHHLIIIALGVFIASCASIGAVIEGGKDLTTSVIDSTVTTAGNITTAVIDDAGSVVNTVGDSVSNVVETVVENVDEQTDAIQNSEEDDNN
tara:strand:- start:949 stop:1242 length:294 start_codon:yes stop_codon:yes gene_type:complete